MTKDLHWTKEGKAVAAICWIAAGVVFLMINFNLLRPEMIAQLWKLWPLVPLAVGVATLLGVGNRQWPIAKNN